MLTPSSLLRVFFIFITATTSGAADYFQNLSTISFDEGYTPLFGDFNIYQLDDGNNVQLHLNPYSGSGFISSNYYDHGFFSAKIKLPGDHTAGIVVAFYTSNADVYRKTHDELDIEFLGNIPGKPWRFQTNIYGNGSTSRGREERYSLWFDPSKEFHRYSILWTANKIIFYVDDVPIREVIRNEAMGEEFPSKPMSLYATIWDASNWATAGGKYKVNYKYSPFVCEYTDLALEGCPVDPILQVPDATASSKCSKKDTLPEVAQYAEISPERRAAMRRFRLKHMYYSSCYDNVRYPVPPPGCVIDPEERLRFKDTGRLKLGGSVLRRRARRRRSKNRGSYNDQADM
ncbi:Glycoside hydrolase family 16 [Dillenia turbinata]|uniref:Xyloglucan endotransglucosylase/hydrolase n=1 Tax=Dillenia turbinata TaxID=194707 RepID=A0AAN8ZI69_9MAGN